MQYTLSQAASLVGTGLHSGRPARITLRPAAEGGIRFHRTDVSDRDPVIPARFDHVVDTTLCTVIGNADGATVATVEHVMAALAGLGVHHAVVEIDGPEVPIMDGSSRRFVAAIMGAGLRPVATSIEVIRILAPIRVEEGEASAELRPADRFEIAFTIDFAEAAIGRQEKALDLANGTFLHELADCRTFCRLGDVEMMQARGLALGGSLENAIVVDGATVLNPGGLRRSDEFVRHKMLDAVGDLALAGAPILGAYHGERAGHGVTNRLLRKLFATEGAWERVTLDAAGSEVLPGVGVELAALRRAG